MAIVCVVGSINLDIVARVERSPVPGETVLGEMIGKFPGGKGYNQAVAAKRCGADIRFCGQIGQDAEGAFLRASMAKAGISDQFLRVSTECATGMAQIALLPNADNSIIVMQGANNALSPHAATKAIKGTNVILVQLEISPQTAEAALVAGRELGITTILNAAPSHHVTEKMLQNADLLVVNESEAHDLGGIEKLLTSGPKAVILTMGERGAIWQNTANERLHVPAFPIEAVDTTGAGDAFCGALAASLCNGLSIKDALQRATAAGAIVATQMGAQTEVLSGPAIDDMLKSARTNPA